MPEREVLDSAATVVASDVREPEEVRAAVREVDAVVVGLQAIDAAAIAAMQRCRVVSRYGIGYDAIDVEAATAAGIWVASVPDYGWEDVSDHALALFLACVRDLRQRDLVVRGGNWGAPPRQPGFRIKGRTFGLIGCGGIGRALARKLSGLGLERILVCDPPLSADAIAAAGGTACDLPTLLRESDFVSVHTPLTSETRGMIGAEQLRLMKPTAILVNTSRGAVLDEAAVAAALANGTVAHAGLDVFEDEPLSADSPLLALDNVVLTDHRAWYTEESTVELASKAARNVSEVLAGRPPVYPVNRIGGAG